MSKAAKLREMLKKPGLIQTGAVGDCLSAKIMEKAGFELILHGGFNVATCGLGYPDLGLLTITESLNAARYVAMAVNVPVIVDIDDGHGGPLNVIRIVQELEQYGVAGLFIEDNRSDDKKVVPMEEHVTKIKAAVESRKNSNFVIVARTHAEPVYGLEETVKRLKAYANAGADVVWSSNQTWEGVKKLPKLVDAPLLVERELTGGDTSILTPKDAEKHGYKILHLGPASVLAAAKGMIEVLTEIRSNGFTEKAKRGMIGIKEYSELFGQPRYVETLKKYT